LPAYLCRRNRFLCDPVKIEVAMKVCLTTISFFLAQAAAIYLCGAPV
jgi:hypothetical protein